MENQIYKYLEVVSYETEDVVKRLDVTGRSESTIDKIERGMNRNMSEAYFTRVVTSKTKLQLI